MQNQLYKGRTIIFLEGGWKILKKIVFKVKKAQINCLKTWKGENEKFAD